MIVQIIKKIEKYENEKYGKSTVFTSNNYVNAQIHVLINEECFQVSQKLPWAQRNRQGSTCQIC